MTGLDCVGIPVVQAVRPLARSNVVTQGKGWTVAEAAIAALMEALETWAAERIPPERTWRAAPGETATRISGRSSGGAPDRSTSRRCRGSRAGI